MINYKSEASTQSEVMIRWDVNRQSVLCVLYRMCGERSLSQVWTGEVTGSTYWVRTALSQWMYLNEYDDDESDGDGCKWWWWKWW